MASKDVLLDRVMGSLNLGSVWPVGSSPAATAKTKSYLGSLKPRLAVKSKAKKFALFYK